MANRENSREQDELSQSTEVEETYFEDSQYDDSEYGDSQYEDSEYEEYDEYEDYDGEEENSSLFAMSEEELDDRPGVNWLSVLSAAVAVILSVAVRSSWSRRLRTLILLRVSALFTRRRRTLRMFA